MTVRMKGAVREENAYFEWLINLVCYRPYSRGLSWRKLFRLLHETEFVYILKMDANRADDGIELRYRFGCEFGCDAEEVLEDRPCSIFEMMVALALRCEEHIMEDSELGNRTGKWFFDMVRSLGLIGMDDAHFDKIAATDILEQFLRREYLPNGQGGLFTVEDDQCDMREIEIWYQLMRYLNEDMCERRK